MLQDKVGIIIVVFNISNLIEKQIYLINKYCKDDYDIIIMDNSNNLQEADNVRRICLKLNCIYNKVNSSADFSQSHASACNKAYLLYKDKYKYNLFLDHDNFPIKDFSIKNNLLNKILGGVGQIRIDKNSGKEIYYYWPGCVMINNQLINSNLVDFSTNPKLGLDTGGNLHKVIDYHGIDSCINFDQYDIQNDLFDHWTYNIICNQKSSENEFQFMHFINASNWTSFDKNNERINSLLIKLENYTQHNVTFARP